MGVNVITRLLDFQKTEHDPGEKQSRFCITKVSRTAYWITPYGLINEPHGSLFEKNFEISVFWTVACLV